MDDVSGLKSALSEAHKLIEVLRTEIAELKRQLSMNSSNSGKPPSSDSPWKKPKPVSLREKGKKPSGGQSGHEGVTLMQTENPDIIIEHVPDCCALCGALLIEQEVISLTKRQVKDIPEPRPEVTEHRSLAKKCVCGQVTAGKFPEKVNAPVQIGKRAGVLATYFSVGQLIPQGRLAQIFGDVFKLPIAKDTLVGMVNGYSERLTPVRESVLTALKACEIKHLDETGFKIGGILHWLHVICDGLMTHYRVSRKRGDLLEDVTGTVVHDYWRPYFKMEGVTHSLCNAHILRELKGLIEHGNEKEGIWAGLMTRLLRLLCRYGERMTEVKRGAARRFYDQIVSDALRLYESLPILPAKRTGNRRRYTGENLAIRLRDSKEAILRFLDGKTPFTNNLAEQALRMMKVKQKISGGFRTFAGAETFCIIRGFIETNRKRGKNIFTALLEYA